MPLSEKWEQEKFVKNEINCFADFVGLLGNEKLLDEKRTKELRDEAITVFPNLLRNVQWEKIKRIIGADKKSIKSLETLERLTKEYSEELSQRLEAFCLDTSSVCAIFDTSTDSMDLNELAIIYREGRPAEICQLLSITREQLIPLLRRLASTVQKTIVRLSAAIEEMKKQVVIAVRELKTDVPDFIAHPDVSMELDLTGKHSITEFLEYAKQLQVEKEKLDAQLQQYSERLQKSLTTRIEKLHDVEKAYKKASTSLLSPVDLTEIDQQLSEIKESIMTTTIQELIDLANMVVEAEDKHHRQKESYLINSYQSAMETIEAARTFGTILRKQPKDFPTSYRVAAYKEADEWTRSIPTVEEAVKTYASILEESEQLHQLQAAVTKNVRETADHMFSQMGAIKEKLYAFDEEVLRIQLEAIEKKLRKIRGSLTSEVLQLHELGELDAETRSINVELRDILKAPLRGQTQYMAPEEIVKKLDGIRDQYEEFNAPLPPGTTETEDINALLKMALETLTWRSQVQEKLESFLRNDLYNRLREHGIQSPDGATPKDIIGSSLESLFNIYEMLNALMWDFKEDMLEKIEARKVEIMEIEKAGKSLLDPKFKAEIPAAPNLDETADRVAFLIEIDTAKLNAIESVNTKFIKMLVSTRDKIVNKDTENIFKTMCDTIDATIAEIERKPLNDDTMGVLTDAKQSLSQALHREFETSRDDSSTEIEKTLDLLPDDAQPERTFHVGFEELKAMKLSGELQEANQDVADFYKKRKNLLTVLSKAIQKRLQALSNTIGKLNSLGVKVDSELSKPPEQIDPQPSRLKVGAELVMKTSEAVLSACSKALLNHAKRISEGTLLKVDNDSDELVDAIDAFSTLDEQLRSEVSDSYVPLDSEQVENLRQTAYQMREIIHELRKIVESFADRLQANI